jgi:hypothetical protein
MDLVRLADPKWEWLTVENWFPPLRGRSLYAFDQEPSASGVPSSLAAGAALRHFYKQLFGTSRITEFDGAFLVQLEESDWSWVRQHGWTLEARCNERSFFGQVPTLFHLGWTFRDLLPSPADVPYVWRGRWTGPPTTIEIRFAGHLTVETGDT